MNCKVGPQGLPALPCAKTYMLSIGLILSLFITATAFLHTSEEIGTPSARVHLSDSQALTTSERIISAPVDSFNAFALDIFGRLSSNKKNVFISPLSIRAALSIAALGVTTNSSLEAEFLNVLRADSVDELAESVYEVAGTGDGKRVKISLANSAWLDFSVKQSYAKTVREDLKATVRPLPDKVSVVNNWVSNKTEGMIKELLSKIPKNTLALLINAVFFKGEWLESFDPKATKSVSFGLSSSAKESVRMMYMKKNKFPYGFVQLSGKGSISLLDIPYGGEKYSATIVLPDEKIRVDDVIAELKTGNVKQWNRWISSLSMIKIDTLGLPRFKVEYGTESLKTALRGMGMTKAFTPSGMFSRMTDAGNTKISDVLHKAVVECTEKGTKAAAGTAVITATSAPIEFIANRPFLFAIRNRKTGGVLFIGRIDNPKDP